MAAAELASIVAAYLRKHGFSKTLAAFSRETGDTPEENDIVDLETLYKLYTSTLVNGHTKTKKPKKSKLEDTLEVMNGNENTTDNAEEKVNEDASSERKKKKKSKKENLVVSPMVPESETKNIPEEGSKKKKVKNPEKGETIEGLKRMVENCTTVTEIHVENGGGLGTKQEDVHSLKPLTKRSKKEKKEQEGEQLAGSQTPLSPADNTQVSSQEDGLSKKKRKKSKDVGEEETKDAIATESACGKAIDVKIEKLDAMKQPVEVEPEKRETSSKKKKKKKEYLPECEGDVNGNIQEPLDAKPEATKNEEDLINSKTQSGKKRKHEEDTSLVNGISNHEYNSIASPEKKEEAGGAEVVHECDVEKHEESGFTKTKKRKETSDKKKTPTGALAFKRVEEEKVSFSDPRLRDNSYWAKDGAEEGYGAKAQEVLGLVRGRGFRHEKTKKKRGSYRGGLIGLESHSIKFENSDEE